MRELLDILKAASMLRTEPFALATVVATEGSTYRKPGARQLIWSNGSAGTVSGGCLDVQVRATAEAVMADGEPRLEVYDLTQDDDLVWGWGLGCSGVTEVLFEPSSTAALWLDAIRSALAADESITSVTLLEGNLGDRLIVDGDGDLGGLDEAARAAAAQGVTGSVDLGGVRAFVDVVRPAPRLVISGANNDAVPLVSVAASLGWRPIVVDPRPRLLTEERFPEAELLITAEPADLARVASPDASTYVVLMNHNFLRDGDVLASLVGTDVAYVGMLGPAERGEQLIEYATKQGAPPTETDLAKFHGPAGLDLGASGPLEIAWSIMAQLLAVSRQRRGGPLAG